MLGRLNINQTRYTREREINIINTRAYKLLQKWQRASWLPRNLRLQFLSLRLQFLESLYENIRRVLLMPPDQKLPQELLTKHCRLEIHSDTLELSEELEEKCVRKWLSYQR